MSQSNLIDTENTSASTNKTPDNENLSGGVGTAQDPILVTAVHHIIHYNPKSTRVSIRGWRWARHESDLNWELGTDRHEFNRDSNIYVSQNRSHAIRSARTVRQLKNCHSQVSSNLQKTQAIFKTAN
jgi:hypothetical protein